MEFYPVRSDSSLHITRKCRRAKTSGPPLTSKIGGLEQHLDLLCVAENDLA